MMKHISDFDSPRDTVQSGAGPLIGYPSLGYCGARLARAPTKDFYEALNYVVACNAHTESKICEDCWARFAVVRHKQKDTTDL